MKRPIIITVGILIILSVLGIWVYLLLFGSPEKTGEVFTNLGFDVNVREAVTVDTSLPEKDYLIDTSSGLQQLTTRPVAGFVSLTATTSSSTVARYAEQGTGHIYDIDLGTGEEKLVSRTTIPRVREAVFSPDGSGVALTSITNYEKNTFVGQIHELEQTLVGENIAPNVSHINFPDNENIQFTLIGDNGTKGFRYPFVTGGTWAELFSTPFKDVTMTWNKEQNYFYNKPAENLPGYLYKIESGEYKPTDILGYSLVAKASDKYIATTKSLNHEYTSNFINKKSGETYESPILFTPEKCVFSKLNSDRIWCAAEIGNKLNLNEWYKGTQTSTDYVWEISVLAKTGRLVGNLKKDSGREIDVSSITISHNEKIMLFTNKLDNTLWKLDL